MDDKRLTISVEEAAKRLSISRGHAYEMVRLGILPHVRFGRRIVVPISGTSGPHRQLVSAVTAMIDKPLVAEVPISKLTLDYSCRELRRELGVLAWAALEDLAFDARIDFAGRLTSATSARRFAANLGINKDTAARALGRLAAVGLVFRNPTAAGYVVAPEAIVVLGLQSPCPRSSDNPADPVNCPTSSGTSADRVNRPTSSDTTRRRSNSSPRTNMTAEQPPLFT